MKKEVLCAVASGSGGHVIPALILVQQWHEQHLNGSIIFCSGSTPLEQEILKKAPTKTTLINLSIDKFIPYKFWLYPKITFQLMWSLYKSFALIYQHRPTHIISTGGLIALPVCLAGRILGSRIEIYELNVIPGKAVKFLMPFAHIIYTPFAQTAQHCSFIGKNFAHKCQLCSYPIRFNEKDKIFQKNVIVDTINKIIQQESVAFSTQRKTIFLLGGSQGSLLLNNALKKFLIANPHLAPYIQIIHQIGSLDSFEWKTFYEQQKIPAYTFSFHDNVKDFYNLADIIICRAGAGTLFEIEFFNKKCIVVPLVASSTAHQIDNAQAMAEKHPNLFTIVEQQSVVNNFDAFNDVIIKQLLPGV